LLWYLPLVIFLSNKKLLFGCFNFIYFGFYKIVLKQKRSFGWGRGMLIAIVFLLLGYYFAMIGA
jgi:hypothetical protein